MWLTPAQGTLSARTSRNECAVAEVEPVQTLGDHDRVAPVDREVEVVGIVDVDRLARAARARIDRRQRVADVVVHVERLQIVRGRDVLWQRPTEKCPTTL